MIPDLFVGSAPSRAREGGDAALLLSVTGTWLFVSYVGVFVKLVPKSYAGHAISLGLCCACGVAMALLVLLTPLV